MGNLPLVNIKCTFYPIFVSLVTLELHFLLDVSIFNIDEEKEWKINSSTIFEACYLNLEEKFG